MKTALKLPFSLSPNFKYVLFHFKYKECTLILSYKKQTLCVSIRRECPGRFTLDCEYFGESSSVDLSLKKVLSAAGNTGLLATFHYRKSTACAFIRCIHYSPFIIFFHAQVFHVYFLTFVDFA